MIGCTMVGTSDLKRAERFYDPLMTLIGQERCYCDEQVSSWAERTTTRRRASSPATPSTRVPPRSATAP